MPCEVSVIDNLETHNQVFLVYFKIINDFKFYNFSAAKRPMIGKEQADCSAIYIYQYIL